MQWFGRPGFGLLTHGTLRCNQFCLRYSVFLPDENDRQEKENYPMTRSMLISDEAALSSGTRSATATSTPSYQAYQILHSGFVAAPVIAGIDKFFHLLVNWDTYLAPAIAKMSPLGAHGLMLVVGVIEIVAGLLVAFKPRIGAYVVALWLCGIIINLLLMHNYYDIALRDFGLSLGALALARLSREFSS
jgi:uncharacterized membrane protein YphA (DoxX/SURF4 family)